MRALVILSLLCASALAQVPFPGSVHALSVGTAGTPGFVPGTGTYVGTQTVTLSTATGGCDAYIYWSATSNPPTTSDTHGTSASVAASETVYAKVIGCPTYTDSAVGSAAYAILTTWTPAVTTTSGSKSALMWYRADSIAQSNGTAVTSWADSTGNGHTATQGAGGNQPVFNTAQINGLPAVTFTNPTFLTIASPPTLTSATILVVMRNFYSSDSLLGGTSASGGLQYSFTGPRNQYMQQSYGDAIGSGNTYVGDNTWRQMAVTNVSEGAYAFYLYSGSATVADGSGTSVRAITGPTGVIGADHGGAGSQFAGGIAEIIVYSSVLSATDITQVQGYLHSRYGL